MIWCNMQYDMIWHTTVPQQAEISSKYTQFIYSKQLLRGVDTAIPSRIAPARRRRRAMWAQIEALPCRCQWHFKFQWLELQMMLPGRLLFLAANEKGKQCWTRVHCHTAGQALRAGSRPLSILTAKVECTTIWISWSLPASHILPTDHHRFQAWFLLTMTFPKVSMSVNWNTRKL